MQHPSSTSNSEHEHGLRALLHAPTTAGVVAFVILVGFRLTFALLPAGTLTSLTNGWTVDYPFAHAWNRLEHTRNAPPRWLVLGSSRMGLGIDPDVMRQTLGVGTPELEKLTMAAGTPWEWSRLFEIEPSFVPGKGDVLLVDIGAWQFNLNRSERFGNRFDRLAEVGSPAWNEVDGFNPAREFFLTLWPYAVYGSSPSDWMQAALTDAGVRKFATHDTEWDSVEAHAKAGGVAHNMIPQNTYADHFRDFVWLDCVEHACRELAQLADTHGFTLVFVRPPTADEYTDLMLDTPSSREAFERVRALMADLTRSDHVRYIEYLTTADLDAPEAGFFIDYGHMTRVGGGLFTRDLVRRMREAGIVTTAPSDAAPKPDAP